MKLFPIHILIKDCSFFIFYLILMKYNLTNESYLPETVSDFPGAPKMTFGNIISATLFYNWIPIIISIIIYYPIVLLVRKVLPIENIKQILIIGILLSLTTPLIYIFGYNVDLNTMKKAEIISWIITFILSISTYYFLNKPNFKTVNN